MKVIFKKFSLAGRLCGAFIVVFVALVAPNSHAQEWDTGYFNPSNGYGPWNGYSLSGAPTNVPAGFRWQTTDTNEVNVMWFAQGWTMGPNVVNGNQTAYYGGFYATKGASWWPSVTNVSLYRNFSNPISLSNPVVVVSMDFGIQPVGTTPNSLYDTNKDVFSFDFLKASSGTSLARISLNPATATISNGLRLEWINNGTNVASDGVTFQAYDIQYGGLYRLTAAISENTFDLSLFSLSPRGTSTNSGTVYPITNYAVLSSNQVVQNGQLSAGTTAQDFDQYSIDWDLSSGSTNLPGGNYMLLNTVSVTTTVPEPSTAALVGLSGLALVGWFFRRQGPRA